MPSLFHQQHAIRRLLKNAEALELSHASVQRLKWFLYASQHDDNVSLTCRHFGISRSTFLRWRDRFDNADPTTLEEESRCPHTVRAPETEKDTVEKIAAIRREQPIIGKSDLQKLLVARFGIRLSTSTIGRVINRHRLFFADTPSHREKRGLVLEAERATERINFPLPSPAYNEEIDGISFSPEAGLTS